MNKKVHLIYGLILGVVVVVTWFASRSLMPPKADTPAPQADYYVATEGELSRMLSLNGKVAWVKSRTVYAPTSGTITSLDLADGKISAGEVVFTVNLVPVVAIEGATPVFRDLRSGDKGADVTQIQKYLGIPQTGVFDNATRQAVEKWQRSVGWVVDGVVNAGHILVLPQLPTPAEPLEGVGVGATVTPGQPVIQTYSATPDVTIELSSNGELPLREGMKATITVDGKSFPGVLAPAGLGDHGENALQVVDSAGVSACNGECAASVQGRSSATVVVDIIEPTKGIKIPTSALRTTPNGETVVTTEDGKFVPVTVVTSHGGQAIVTGIDDGAKIRLFGATP